MNDTALLKAIIDNVADGILVIDHNGTILTINPSACNLFGYHADELLGRHMSILVNIEDTVWHSQTVVNRLQTDYANLVRASEEIRAAKKDGTTFYVRLLLSEVKYNHSKIFAAILHDLTPEKEEAEQQHHYNNQLEAVVEERTAFLKNVVQTLEKAKDEVNISLLKEKEVNQLKTRFVSIASHEFRTPLSSIQLSASLIEHYFDRLSKDKVFLHLKKIKAAVVNLTSTLNDFLSIERIESGKTTPNFKIFDVQALCTELVDEFSMQASLGQVINYEHIGTLKNVYLDYNLTRHCLDNLLSNAVKYSGENGVINLKTDINDDLCKIEISDNGIGIPQQDQSHLFEAFFRASNTDDIQGTGLGLNIVKRYTELMGGQIHFKSAQNEGAIFMLRFPQVKHSGSEVPHLEKDHFLQ